METHGGEMTEEDRIEYWKRQAKLWRDQAIKIEKQLHEERLRNADLMEGITDPITEIQILRAERDSLMRMLFREGKMEG